MDSPPEGWTRHDPYRPSSGPETAARQFHELVRQRRSVRMFSSREVSRETIEQCVLAAGTAPSGANKQPWRFIAIDDPIIKSEIRAAAEAEEREFYARRASDEWLADLAPLGTDEHKPFLEVAPWLIAVFKLVRTDADRDGRHHQAYYVNESVGIAVGLLLTALHHAGLAALTHTPSPMAFLAKILRRPRNERPFLLIPVGYPADDCIVPDIERKPLGEILVWNRE